MLSRCHRVAETELMKEMCASVRNFEPYLLRSTNCGEGHIHAVIGTGLQNVV